MLAVFLLAVWLPATQHCALEAAGLIRSHCESAETGDDHGCVNDACPTVESALFVTAHSATALVAPAIHKDDCVLCLAVIAARAVDTQQPLVVPRACDWIVAWSFAHRTAPPSRAPTSLRA